MMGAIQHALPPDRRSCRGLGIRAEGSRWGRWRRL